MPTSCDLRARPYKCGCSRYCKILRPVSKTTFYAHAKYRELDHHRSSNRLICGSRTHWLSCVSVASMSSTGTLSKKEKSTKVNVKSAKSHRLFVNKCPIFLTDTSQVSVKQSKAKVNV